MCLADWPCSVLHVEWQLVIQLSLFHLLMVNSAVLQAAILLAIADVFAAVLCTAIRSSRYTRLVCCICVCCTCMGKSKRSVSCEGVNESLSSHNDTADLFVACETTESVSTKGAQPGHLTGTVVRLGGLLSPFGVQTELYAYLHMLTSVVLPADP